MSERSLDAATGEPSDAMRTPDVPRSGNGTSWWGRVAVGVLGAALLALGLRRRSLGGAAMALAGGWLSYRAVGGRRRTAGRSGSATTAGRDRPETDDSRTVERSITVGKPAADLSEFLRDSENLDRIVGEFAEVSRAGEDGYDWVVHAPLGRELSWESHLLEDRPGESLRWESTDDEAVIDDWTATFRPAPGDRGTEVTFRIDFDPPGGRLGGVAMDYLGVVPEALVGRTLDRFKSLVETGVIPTTEGTPSARGMGDRL